MRILTVCFLLIENHRKCVSERLLWAPVAMHRLARRKCTQGKRAFFIVATVRYSRARRLQLFLWACAVKLSVCERKRQDEVERLRAREEGTGEGEGVKERERKREREREREREKERELDQYVAGKGVVKGRGIGDGETGREREKDEFSCTKEGRKKRSFVSKRFPARRFLGKKRRKSRDPSVIGRKSIIGSSGIDRLRLSRSLFTVSTTGATLINFLLRA
jgi:hypothetical protein